MNVKKINSVLSRLYKDIPKMGEYYDFLKSSYLEAVVNQLDVYHKHFNISIDTNLKLEDWEKIDYLVREKLNSGEDITLFSRDYKTEPSVDLYERDQYEIMDSKVELSFRREVNETELYNGLHRIITDRIQRYEAELKARKSRQEDEKKIKDARIKVVESILAGVAEGKTPEEIVATTKFLVRI